MRTQKLPVNPGRQYPSRGRNRARAVTPRRPCVECGAGFPALAQSLLGPNPMKLTALAALGLSRLVTRPATIGFGKAYPEFWINLRAGMTPVPPESGTHICLRAKTTRDVDAFHAAALASGGHAIAKPRRLSMNQRRVPGHFSP